MSEKQQELKLGKRKVYKKIKSDCLQWFIDDFKLNQTQVAKLLGVSPSTITKWANNGEVPKMAELAIEQLRREMKPSDNVIAVISGGKDVMSKVEEFAGFLKVKFTIVK